MASGAEKLCHLYVNDPGHAFDQGLKAEGERVAAELTRRGSPIRVELRYGRGNEQTQLQQIEADGACASRPILRRHPHQPGRRLHDPHANRRRCSRPSPASSGTGPLRAAQGPTPDLRVAPLQRRRGPGRDRPHPGAAVRRPSPWRGGGDVLYVQGRANSFATAERMKGLLAEFGLRPAG